NHAILPLIRPSSNRSSLKTHGRYHKTYYFSLQQSSDHSVESTSASASVNRGSAECPFPAGDVLRFALSPSRLSHDPTLGLLVQVYSRGRQGFRDHMIGRCRVGPSGFTISPSGQAHWTAMATCLPRRLSDALTADVAKPQADSNNSGLDDASDKTADGCQTSLPLHHLELLPSLSTPHVLYALRHLHHLNYTHLLHTLHHLHFPYNCHLTDVLATPPKFDTKTMGIVNFVTSICEGDVPMPLYARKAISVEDSAF
ncbi:unnamed protein product, partial [Protopolystoma xenopodis]